MNIADSIITLESVPLAGLAEFCADFFPQLAFGPFFFESWASYKIRYRRSFEWKVFIKRWQDIYALAEQSYKSGPSNRHRRSNVAELKVFRCMSGMYRYLIPFSLFYVLIYMNVARPKFLGPPDPGSQFVLL